MLVYLSLGSNLGDKESNLLKAVELINEKVGTPIKRSAFFYSKPWGFSSDNDFCNICLAVETHLRPEQTLSATQQIERQMGRITKNHYADRIIDIDLIEYYENDGQIVQIKSKTLTLPHPLMQQRDFVMIPLAEIKKS